jgi:hypothetical protein
VACPLTLCLSELGLYQNAEDAKRREARAQWYQGLTPAQQAREDQREQAALMGLGMALSGGGPFAPRPVAPVAPVAPIRPALQCTGAQIGTTTYLNCP